MATRDLLRQELRNRLKDPGGTVWTDPEVDGFLDSAVVGLYPHYFLYQAGVTTAGAGPLQVGPTGIRNIHFVGVKRTGSTRVRQIRGWEESDGGALVPKVNITGQELSWAWTEPFAKPTNGSEELTLPPQAEEVVILRASVTALEQVLSDRVKKQRYNANQVREGVTEEDIGLALDGLHASIDARLKAARALPEIRK